MTDTALATDPDGQARIHPSDALLRVIIALLTPAFLTACGGDTQTARLAAFETIKQYRPSGHVELILAAQIIACGLASAASGIMSLREDFSPSLSLRLRANAAALSRAAERVSRSLAETTRPNGLDLRFPEPLSPDQLEYETKVLSDVADAQARTQQALARLNVNQGKADAAKSPHPATTPVAAATTHPAARTASTPAAAVMPAPAPAEAPAMPPARSLADQQSDAIWAGAMTAVAHEFTAELESMPPAEREDAIRKAAILSNVANTLLTKGAPRPLRPGDANPTALLAASFHSNHVMGRPADKPR